MRRWAPPGAAVKEPFWVPVARMAALRMHRRRWRGFVNHLGPDSRNPPPNPEAEPRKRVRMSRHTAVDSESFQGAWGYCAVVRSEEHTSELQSLMRISYAVFCLKKKTQPT